MSEKALEKVKVFLDSMGVNYVFDEEEGVIVAPFKIKGKVYPILIMVMGEWVLTVARLVNMSELPSNLDREKFYQRLLRDTFYLSEITYGLMDNGDVVVHASTHIDALNYKDFRTEFASIIAGISHYRERIEPALPMK